MSPEPYVEIASYLPVPSSLLGSSTIDMIDGKKFNVGLLAACTTNAAIGNKGFSFKPCQVRFKVDSFFGAMLLNVFHHRRVDLLWITLLPRSPVGQHSIFASMAFSVRLIVQPFLFQISWHRKTPWRIRKPKVLAQGLRLAPEGMELLSHD